VGYTHVGLGGIYHVGGAGVYGPYGAYGRYGGIGYGGIYHGAYLGSYGNYSAYHTYTPTLGYRYAGLSTGDFYGRERAGYYRAW
jgi:hypothetical protein